jgi:hypothetical protein
MGGELFELCKEVFNKLTWDDISLNDWGDKLNEYGQLVPLYTSDYLLEKLPTRLQQGELFVGKWGVSYWRAGYFNYDPAWSELRAFDTTPLKALLKLTIALHEAGELK